MSANNLYRGLFELLTVPPGADGAALSLARDQAGRRELLSVARLEGCLPELYARWAAAGLLSASESVEHDQLMRRRAAAADVLRVLPKGAVLAESNAVQRGAGTLDVLIADFAAIGPLHEALGSLGFRLQAGGEWNLPVRGPMHGGTASIRYAMSVVTSGAVAVTVQVGGVALDARRHVPFSDLGDKSTRIDGLTCRTLAPTRDLLHRIARFGAQPTPVTVRQIADIHLLLQSGAQRIDHAWLRLRAEQLQAWQGLRQIRDAIAAKRLGALLSWGEFGQLIERGAARGDALAAQRARNPRLGTLLKTTFDLVRSPRNNDGAARLARAPWLVSRVLEAGYRVHGVPVSTRTFDAPRFMRIDGALYLATGAGLILLSLVDLNEGARANLAERVRMGGRPVVLARWTAGRARTSPR